MEGREAVHLEDYFDFLRSDDIRVKGTRVGIETILTEYIHHQRGPEEIAARYPSVTLEQVYATILYYLQNREQVSQYLSEHLAWVSRARQEAQANPSPAARRLQALRAEIDAYPPEERDLARARIIGREQAKQDQTASPAEVHR